MQIKQTHNKGFTLVELMVSVSIFAIVMMISMSAIFTIVDANKKAQSLKSVMNNLNFALETMTRTIKTGQVQSSNGQSTSISVVDQGGDDVIYRLNSKRIERSEAGGSYVPITAEEVEINRLDFYISGVGPTGSQPVVIMIVQGIAKLNERVSSKFTIQTAITQRLLDE